MGEYRKKYDDDLRNAVDLSYDSQDRKRALMGVCRRVISPLKSDCHPVFKIDHQMHQYAAPMTDWHRPFFSDFHGHQIELLHKGIFADNCTFCFRDLAKLAVEVLNRVRMVKKVAFPLSASLMAVTNICSMALSGTVRASQNSPVFSSLLTHRQTMDFLKKGTLRNYIVRCLAYYDTC